MKRLISAVAVAAVAIMAFASVASANVAPYQPTNSLTATTVYNGVTYVHKYAITTKQSDNSFAGVNTANSPVGINESVSGTLNGSNIAISGAYHDGSGYTWSYHGPLTGGTGHDSLGLTWHVSLTTNASFVDVTPYHADNNDAEWGPDSCSGLHTVVSGANASITDTFTCTSTTGKPLTGLKPLQHVTLATVQGWGSDFAGTDASNAATGWHYGWTAKSFDGIVSLNGKSIVATATY